MKHIARNQLWTAGDILSQATSAACQSFPAPTYTRIVACDLTRQAQTRKTGWVEGGCLQASQQHFVTTTPENVDANWLFTKLGQVYTHQEDHLILPNIHDGMCLCVVNKYVQSKPTMWVGSVVPALSSKPLPSSTTPTKKTPEQRQRPRDRETKRGWISKKLYPPSLHKPRASQLPATARPMLPPIHRVPHPQQS